MESKWMSLRQLRAVAAVARTGSASEAARELHVSQPAVTQAVATMEHELGAPLFARSSLGMHLTAAGELCYERIGRALGLIEAALIEAAGHKPPISASPLRYVTASQLQALWATVRCGNFAAAARSLGVAVPTIHRAARDLERLLAATLYERTSRGVVATRVATDLARRVSVAQVELEQARAEVAALADDDRGRTVIGAMPLARSALVPRAVLALAARYPQHEIAIWDGPYSGMVEALRHGEIDVLVGALRELDTRSDLVQEPLFDDPIVIVGRAGHPLMRRQKPRPAELAKFAWLAPRRESPLRRHFEALRASFPATQVPASIECNSLVAARALLLESDRLMLSSVRQVQREIEFGLLATLPHPSGLTTRTIGLTFRREWRPTKVQRALLALLRANAETPPCPRRSAVTISAR